MTFELPSSSRFKLSDPVVTQDGKETFGLMKKFDFLSSDEYIDLRIDASMAHRPDLISNEFYGTPSFFWVVIMVNKPRNPFQWPKIGDVIRLPISSVVIPEL